MLFSYVLIVEYHSTNSNIFFRKKVGANLIYETIKKIADSQGKSIRSIEVELGWGNGTLNRWNDHSPTVEKLLAVSEYLNVPLERLIRGDDERG